MENSSYDLINVLNDRVRSSTCSNFILKYFENKVASSSILTGEIYIWDIFSGKLIFILMNEETVYGITFSSDGNNLLTGGITGKIKKWDLTNGLKINDYTGHNDCVYCIEYSHNGLFFVSSGMDKIVKIWNNNCELLNIIEIGYEINYLVISPVDDFFAVSGWNDKLTIWNIDGKKKYILEDTGNQFLKVFFSPSGKYLASRHYYNVIKVWNIELEKNEKKFEIGGFGDIRWKNYGIKNKKIINDILIKKLPVDIVEYIFDILNNKFNLIYNNQILFTEK